MLTCKGTFLLLIALLCISLTAVLAAQKPVIYFDMQPDSAFARELSAEGIQYEYTPPHQGAWKGWTRDSLKHYNTIVLTEYPQVGTGGPTPEQQRYIELLRWYVEQGGGLLLFGGNNQDSGMCVRFQNELLKPYGAQVLREHVLDKETRYKGRSFTYGWTDRITPDPLTAGVTGLYYAMVNGWGGTSTTNPVQVDASWKVLVTAGKSAYTCALFDTKPMPDTPATYAGAPPLLAVKQVGAGRIVLWPTLATTTVVDGYHYLWDSGLVLSGKVGERGSQGWRLISNLFKYLVEPTLAAGVPDNYVPKLPPKRSLENEPGFKQIDWDTATVPNELPQCYKTLIGARTRLSSGTGTVRDYAEAAKQHGYQVLVITEDLERMSEEKWKTLEKECRDASTADFRVIPGYKFFDENENQGVVFGDIGWVKKEWMSEKSPGRIKEISYWTHGYAEWPPVAIITPTRNPKRPWFLGTCHGYATFTYQNGKLIDESVSEYLELVKNRFDNFQLAVHLLDSPAQVAQAAAAGNMQTYVRAKSLALIVRHMSRGMHDIGWRFPVFVSNGPIIGEFQAYNFGTADLTLRGGERIRLRLAVSSAAPIREVKLTDGGALYRRFLTHELNFDRSWDFFHDRQHTFVADITDAQGRRAISWLRWTEAQEQYFGNCGDNWNIMPGGKWSGSRYLTTRGFETYFSQAPSSWVWPAVLTQQDGKTQNIMPARPAVHVNIRMASRFASIVDYEVDGAYPPDETPNWNDFCNVGAITPLDTLRTRTRRIFYTPRPDHVQVELLEGRITPLKPLSLAPGHPVQCVRMTSNGLLPLDHLSISDVAKGDLVLRRSASLKGSQSWNGTVMPGGYLSIWPHPGGAVGAFALDADTEYKAWFYENAAGFSLHSGTGGVVWPAGKDMTYRFLNVQGHRFAETESNEEMEWVKAGFGLRGAPQYRVTSKVGSIKATGFPLILTPEDGGFLGEFRRTRLPMDLPVKLEGLNEHWQAGVWYAGEQALYRPYWNFDEYNRIVPELKEDRMTDAVFPGPVFEGAGYFQVDVEKADRTVFLGHFLVCGNREIFLQLLDTRPGKRAFEAHNPTDKDITTTVRPGKGFTLLGSFNRRLKVPAGSSVIITLDNPQTK
ncbi:MAG: hypothetical protein ACYC7E_02860 [Armatimonadota bacterium]